jgi:hypothetical protein
MAVSGPGGREGEWAREREREWAGPVLFSKYFKIAETCLVPRKINKCDKILKIFV